MLPRIAVVHILMAQTCLSLFKMAAKSSFSSSSVDSAIPFEVEFGVQSVHWCSPMLLVL